MEQQILELVSIVREGLPVVAEQAVRLRFIHECLSLVVALLLFSVSSYIVFKSVCVYRKNVEAPYGGEKFEEFAVLGMTLGTVAVLVTFGIFCCSLATIIGILACPDYYAVKEVLQLIPGAK